MGRRRLPPKYSCKLQLLCHCCKPDKRISSLVVEKKKNNNNNKYHHYPIATYKGQQLSKNQIRGKLRYARNVRKYKNERETPASASESAIIRMLLPFSTCSDRAMLRHHCHTHRSLAESHRSLRCLQAPHQETGDVDQQG